MPNEYNEKIIEEFRANGGRVTGENEGAGVLLLTTIGARSGRPHTTPLSYLDDGDDRVLVIASAGGTPRNPAWYYNLLAHPRVTVEIGTTTYEAEAIPLDGPDRDRAFARAAADDPTWADYEARAGRVIPVVALQRIDR